MPGRDRGSGRAAGLGMGAGILLDASSPIYALKKRRSDALNNGFTQWLALYEAINALWK